MTSIVLKHTSLTNLPKRFVRVVWTNESTSHHRFVESSDGTLELRMGTGKPTTLTSRQFITLIRSAVASAKAHHVTALALTFDRSAYPKLLERDETWFASTLAENLTLASYEFRRYKTKKERGENLREIVCILPKTKSYTTGFARGLTVATVANNSRDIVNTPGDDMTPRALASALSSFTKGTSIKVTAFDERRIQRENLHALYAVGKGADDKPRFIIMEYWPLGKPASAKDTKRAPIVLVGKGVTYDTGGLNIKPTGSMHDMHMDMSGGATVAAALVAVAKLKLKKNIVVLIPTAENAVSDRSMRAGDIINSHSGKTIEVLHTDAEGRLVLADGLSYATRYHPRVLIDVATLTGASLVALGQQASAVMTEDDTLREMLTKLGEESGDYTWPLPLWDEYKVPLRQSRADVVNIHPSFSKYGGAIEGAAFLSYFVPKGVPWAHFEMAPRMDAIPSDKLAKGSTGEPIRLLVRFLEQY